MRLKKKKKEKDTRSRMSRLDSVAPANIYALATTSDNFTGTLRVLIRSRDDDVVKSDEEEEG